MINRIMKSSGQKAYIRDLARIDESRMDKSVLEYRDINYLGDDSIEHTLDICFREDGKIKPIVIDIHGGGFISHDKSVDRLFCNYLAQNGAVVFSVNYRLAYPEFTVMNQISDIDKAVSWVVKHAGEYGGDANRLYIVGHSSGGVLALAESLLCVDSKMREEYGLPPRTYSYSKVMLDCGLMHFYKNSIAYNGMRDMVFGKGYKKDPRYSYLVFEKNEMLSKLPEVTIVTNAKDELKAMSYYMKGLLDKAGVKNSLIDSGEDGHMGILFNSYSEANQGIISEFVSNCSISNYSS
ncbi:MAG: alpha/beta hydrolase [Saccharofermentans sp.]|nr:alpha/beta hydrolase [Saccharofermentans sp.]